MAALFDIMAITIYLQVFVIASCAICFTRAFAAHSSKHCRVDVIKLMAMKERSMKIVAEPRTAGINRRDALLRTVSLPLPALLSSTPTAHAAMENAGNPFEKVGKLSIEEAEDRLRLARKSAQYLLDNYGEICEGGGDNVRRYLGTVGTTSGLFGIQKVLKSLADKADDFVEYTEASAEVEKCIQQADGSAYMAIFVTTSTSYTPPAKYFGDAKVEIKRLIIALDQLAELVGVKY